MTYLERYMKENEIETTLEAIKESVYENYCPEDCNEEECTDVDMTCEVCWNREMINEK